MMLPGPDQVPHQGREIGVGREIVEGKDVVRRQIADQEPDAARREQAGQQAH